MYCGTYLKSRYKKIFSEELVSVASFNYVTRELSIELIEKDEVFEGWTCTTCGKTIHQEVLQRALDNKLEQWMTEKSLCVFTHLLSN